MEKKYTNHLLTWKVEERPREKLIAKGNQSLEDEELLAILIGSGSRSRNAVLICKEIMDYVNNDLVQLGKLSVKDLTRFKGVGEAKAISIVAAMELGRRRQAENVKDMKAITCSKDIFRLFLQDLSDINHEEFWVLYLNRGNIIIGKEKISSGGLSGTVADSRMILKNAIERLASSIILVHNHPSGNLTPSAADRHLTEKIKVSGEILNIVLLDHVIISGTGYMSFSDDGLV